jgi:hypothetical protein
MITTIYRVSVDIPEDVYREFGLTREYEQMCFTACRGAMSSGENAYSEIEVWAEFHNKQDAYVC